MIVAVIWIVVFAVVAGLAWKGWEGSFGKMVKRWVPVMLRVDDGQGDQIIWSLVVGALAATLITNPASLLLTLLLIAFIALVIRAVIRFAMKKVH